MKFTLTIDLDNDAFQGDAGADEVVRILDKLAGVVGIDGLKPRYSWPCQDANGNAVGKATVTE